MIKIDGLVLGFGGFHDQRIRFRLVKVEAFFDDGMQLVTLHIGNAAVDTGDMNQERRRRQPVIIEREMGGLLAAARNLIQEFAEAFKHWTTDDGGQRTDDGGQIRR